MTDDKGAGDGPYFITQEQDKEIGATWFLVNGPGIDDPKMTATADRDEAIVSASIRNRAYIEGQKAEEMIWGMQFDAWKKARGIE